ncbi:AcrR family transcriptional regulator [Streptosporangium becharense]|uniref:AcrR family transcriptional regulator n=1 Tax=Streptosporangium becharense TaxID=1816182 RepID=A0A7W9MF71_9ACTN|nr:TetR/AcrR family transcriptional regulator [Streptosporangium becharense]MBB2911953.1 AcrR family transcriptional regulator [Streptosporangium becharense]MBB5818500.1 AcrR family transcriptional regulator [Streptosporangium becharense]
MTTTDETRPARPTGRPRSVRAEAAIIDAALDLIGEGMTFAELSIEAIAARAGVGKTTIYRRWSNKEDLVIDALTKLKAPLPKLEGESVREDLIAYLRIVQRDACDARSRCVMNIAMNDAERHPRLAERFRQAALEPRRAAMAAMLRRGMATGELRADLDVPIAMAMLAGTMMWYIRGVESGGDGEISQDTAERIVDQLLAGLGPR